MKIVIPARRNSKGLPYKNRRLFDYTARSVASYGADVIVTSDDPYMKEKAAEYGFTFHLRSRENSVDTASTKNVLKEVIKDCIINKKEIVVMLYLTYPQRSIEDIEKGLRFLNEKGCKSMLCAEEISVSPYLMMYRDGLRGRQIIEHNLYRRQDYPECFHVSHFLCIFIAEELDKLNLNLYNSDTMYMEIDNVIDIDTPQDLEIFTKKG